MHLYLIGYRGSGKSTVGKTLATRLNRIFIDTDSQIEQITGKTIREIFTEQGEPAFRLLEEREISRVANMKLPAVVALGGGAILSLANRENLQTSGYCVWLSASPGKLFARICADQNSPTLRPNLTNSGGYAEVEAVLAVREPIYCKLASKMVITDEKSPDEVVEEILDWEKSLA
ncbi:MAG: shikimate kinase [Planctomycetales bacterium]|nr:shikimate kinase [Planctomycetales bacterium]